ncbi:MAG: response regulator [Hyphomicrobiaceae bacterium]
MRELKTGSGSNILARRHDARAELRTLSAVSDILIVEDTEIDAQRLAANLRDLFGRTIEVRRAATLAAAVDLVLKKVPDLLLLDDYLKPADTATESIPFLRRAGYHGPILVISGAVDRQRRAQLKSLGVSDCLHKDDMFSGDLAMALLDALRSDPAGPEDRPE